MTKPQFALLVSLLPIAAVLLGKADGCRSGGRLPATVVETPLSDWSEWSDCSSRCGQGQQSRWRELMTIGAAIKMNETKTCQRFDSCPASHAWSSWSAWSSCSVSCGGGGRQQRGRECVAVTFGPVLAVNSSCNGSQVERRDCGMAECPPTHAWSSWRSWSACSVSCGGGTQQRTRSCRTVGVDVLDATAGGSCEGSGVERRACGTAECPPANAWSSWSSWSACSVTCGGGSRQRSRSCRNTDTGLLEPGGNESCNGTGVEQQACGSVACPSWSSWSSWSAWSACSVTCGAGQSTRSRARVCQTVSAKVHCENPNATSEQERRACSFDCSPVDGGWSAWTRWSICLVTCGHGRQWRRRYCNNPERKFGGADCQGEKNDMQSCLGGECPVDGQWGGWKPCGDCVTKPVDECSLGIRRYCRQCDDPKPEFGGSPCTRGDAIKLQHCWNVKACDSETAQPPLDFKVVGFMNTTDLLVTWRRAPYGLAAKSFLLKWKTSESEQTFSALVPVATNASELGERYDLWLRNYTKGTTVRIVIVTQCPPKQHSSSNLLQSSITERTFTVSRVDGSWGPWGSWGPCEGTSNCLHAGKRRRTRLCDSPAPANGGLACEGLDWDEGVCFNPC